MKIAAYAAWIPYHSAGYAVGISGLDFKLKPGIDSYDFRSNMGHAQGGCVAVKFVTRSLQVWTLQS